jgi:hypothetical protein
VRAETHRLLGREEEEGSVLKKENSGEERDQSREDGE